MGRANVNGPSKTAPRPAILDHACALAHPPPLQIPSINYQQPTDNEHRNCRAAVYAERNGPATALMQHDHGINDRNESGGGHEPAKDVCGPVSHKDCDEQSRCNVTNAFSE